MADSAAACEILDILVGEGRAYLAVMGDLADMVAEDGDSAIFLPAMLKKIDSLVDVEDAGSVGVNAEDTAVIVNIFHGELLE